MAGGIIQVEKPILSKSTSGRKLKTMLLFPPEWVPTAPYLALPSLTAVLRQHGHEVVQKDVNIEMYDYFFSDTFLIWVMARDRKSTRLNSSHGYISYAVFCLKKKKKLNTTYNQSTD